MMSLHSSTHSSQMNTLGPAISLRTSCWLFPQNEQYRILLLSPERPCRSSVMPLGRSSRYAVGEYQSVRSRKSGGGAPDEPMKSTDYEGGTGEGEGTREERGGP